MVAVSVLEEIIIEIIEEVLEEMIEDRYGVQNNDRDSIEVYELQEYFELNIELPRVVEDYQLLGNSYIYSILVTTEEQLVSTLENEQIEVIFLNGTNHLIDISNSVYVNRPVTFLTNINGETRLGGLNLMNRASLIVTETRILTNKATEQLSTNINSARVFINNDSGGNAALIIDGEGGTFSCTLIL